MLKIGPIGNTSFAGWDEEGRSEIVQIFVSHGDKIYSLQFQFYENGSLTMSDRHGQIGGSKFDVVTLHYPREYLTCISCFTFGSLTSITFTTNMGRYGPFGQAGRYDREFQFQLGPYRQFGGFCGTADSCVRSIGVYIKPITTLNILGRKDRSPVDQEKLAIKSSSP